MACSRPLHTAPLRFQFVKDVYKRLNYMAPYNQGEKDTILLKINQLSEVDLQSYISKRMSRAIAQHREKVGEFECVEQLLDMPKMDPKTIQKACLGLLQSSADLKDQQAEDLRRKQSFMFSRDIIPKPDIKIFTEHHTSSPSVCGININLRRISYAKVEFPSGRLVAWSVEVPAIPLQDLQGIAPYQHHRLYETACEAVEGGVRDGVTFEGLPDADYYCVEEMLPILPKDPSLKAKIHLLKLRHAFLAVLMEKKQKPFPAVSPQVHTMKPQVVDTMFDLKIGNERKSMKIEFHSLIQEGDDEGNFLVDIEEEQWDYYGRTDSHAKETLLACVAQALAFHRLCVLNEERD